MWDKITESIVIDNPTDFIQTALDDDQDEFIMVEVEKKYKCYLR